MTDPLWNEIAAFLCRHVLIPHGHQLGPGSRLQDDLRLSRTEARDLMERFFTFFRVRSEGFDAARALSASKRRWPWTRRRHAEAADISAAMLLSAARAGHWPRPCADAHEHHAAHAEAG